MPNPCSHTMLINSAIGFCMKDDSWIHPLADLKYKPELIEQTIGTKVPTERVQPDVVATSQKLNHSVVIECKGGKTLDTTQISKYHHLTPQDIIRWVRVYDPNQHTLDICLLIYKTNETTILNRINIPVLSLSDMTLEKHNEFSKQQLNQKFSEPIPTTSLMPPISYYPFSEIDDRRVIIPHAMRAMQLAIDARTDQIDVTDPELFISDAIMKQIHRVWDIISKEQQRALKLKVTKVIKELIQSYPDLKSFLERTQTIDKRDTVKLVSLDNLCANIQQTEMHTTLDDFPR